jgi:Flp pilus assembly protein TadG
MTMRGLKTFLRDRRGLAGVEFAFIAPIVIAVLVLGVDGWQRESQIANLRTAMHTGARYYENGGSDDVVAQSVSTAAWTTRPQDGLISVARACTCGGTTISCTGVCNGTNLPSVFITLSGTGTFTGLLQSHAISQSDVIRVR